MKVHSVMADRFGKNLVKYRVAKGLSQDQLAKSLGVSSAYVSFLEGNARSPSLDMIEKAAAFFKLDPSRMVAP